MTVKTILLHSFVALSATALVLAFPSCKREKNEAAEHHHHHAEGGEASDEITLDPQRAEKFGVKTTRVEPSAFHTTLAVGGELIPSTSAQSTVAAKSAGIVHLTAASAPGSQVSRGQTIATVSGKGMAGGDANEVARTAMQAAKRELDRLTPLHADGIVSTRDYNAALQAYESAKAACGNASNSAGSAATAPASGTVTALLVSEGQFVESGTPIAEISGDGSLTLKANLPERDMRFLPQVTGARFRTAYSDKTYDVADFNGRRSSGTASVAANGYIPVYFTLTNDGTLASGSYCEVFLTGDSREGVISVPLSALSEQQGVYFVYTRLDEDCYDKIPVETGASEGDRVEIVSGLKGGEEVVTEGVTFVRLAESSGVVPEGHKH